MAKPKVEFTGANGNVYNLMAITSRALRENGEPEKAKEMNKRVTTEAKNYAHAIQIMQEYVEVE